MMTTAYWHIVLRCLTDFLDFDDATARSRLREYRLLLSQTPPHLDKDLVYHLEPWVLAQRLAQVKSQKLSKKQYEHYGQLVREAEAEAAVLGTEQEVQIFSLSA